MEVKGENMQTARTQDPTVVASHNYRVLLENKRMRAIEYRSRPGDRTAFHAHPACLVYSFCPSTVQITTSYGANAEYEFKAGEVIWMDEGAHCTENIGATDARLLIVEFKEPPMEREMPGIWWED
jgi:quercetin dioxygenase-like cupin family protein